MTTTTARVDVLTAEVRVLMIGSRQVTLSVYRQLDEITLSAVTPFGRVQTGDRPRPGGWDDGWEIVRIVGADRDGQLVASHLSRNLIYQSYADPAGSWRSTAEGERVWAELSDLPLIVLAGLR